MTKLGRRRSVIGLENLTNLDPDHVIDGSLDLEALSWLCDRVPGTNVRHLLHLHAKAYVAGDHTAIVTSANLTSGGIWTNHKLGIAFTDPKGVVDIIDDLKEYGNLGVAVPCDELAGLDTLAQRGRSDRVRRDAVAQTAADEERARLHDAINERLIELRTAGEEFASDPGGSLTRQFADAVLYVLRRQSPLPTSEVSPLVRNLKPELWDDNVDRIIGGRAFGKRWKHDIRNAQQQLK